MRKYEVMYIIRPNIDDESKKQLSSVSTTF